MALHSAAGWDKPQQSLQELSLAVKSTWMHTSVALGPLQAQLLELAGRVAQLEQQLANVRAIDAEEAPPSE